MKTFASVLEAVGLAAFAGGLASWSPVLGVLALGVELVVIGLALENR